MSPKPLAQSSASDMPPAEAIALAKRLHEQYVVGAFFTAGDPAALAEAAEAFGFAPDALKDIVRAALMDILTRMAKAAEGFNQLTDTQTDEKNLIGSANAQLETEKQQHNGWTADTQVFLARISAAAKALQVDSQVAKAVNAKQILKKQPKAHALSAMAILTAAITRPTSGAKAIPTEPEEGSVWTKEAIISKDDPRVAVELAKIEVRSKKVAADAAFLQKAMANLAGIGYTSDKIVAFLADLTVACQEQLEFDTQAIAEVTEDTAAFVQQLTALTQEEGELTATAQFFSVKM